MAGKASTGRNLSLLKGSEQLKYDPYLTHSETSLLHQAILGVLLAREAVRKELCRRKAVFGRFQRIARTSFEMVREPFTLPAHGLLSSQLCQDDRRVACTLKKSSVTKRLFVVLELACGWVGEVLPCPFAHPSALSTTSTGRRQPIFIVTRRFGRMHRPFFGVGFSFEGDNYMGRSLAQLGEISP
jgi:hypothetical protein